MPTTNQSTLRQALGSFATGVTIITTCTAAGKKTGVTANSFSSISLSPPLVLWNLRKNSTSLSAFEQSDHFAINILSQQQTDLALHFSRTMPDKFSGIAHTSGINNLPLFPESCAIFQCTKQQVIEVGDHWLFIGEIIKYDSFAKPPLLFHQGGFANLVDQPASA